MTARKTSRKPDSRLEWFRQARFGLLVHWGPFSVLGRGEWVRQGQFVTTLMGDRMSVEEYEQRARGFHPAHFDPDRWMADARSAGMKYAIFVAKHIDGFCLFETDATDYSSVRTASRTDFAKGFADAARAAGLKVGFYYSLIDWHHPDAVAGTRNEQARRRQVEYVHTQVGELCSNYGPIDVLYYDMPWTYTAEEWESEKLLARVRALQPNILINDRSKIPGDFSTPEQYILPAPYGRDWEAALTFNDHWPWAPSDANWKSAPQILSLLARCAAWGGNLLLNVGPEPDGAFPGPCVTELKKVGAWLNRNGESIYASNRVDHGGFDFGPVTARGNTLYLHVQKTHRGKIQLKGLENTILGASLLGGDKPIQVQRTDAGYTLTGIDSARPDSPRVVALKLNAPPKFCSV